MDNSQVVNVDKVASQHILTVWDTNNTLLHIKRLADQAHKLKNVFQEIGDNAAEELATTKSAAPLIYNLNFRWTEQAKGFLILWRDILFEQQKGLILQADNQLQEIQVEQHQAASKTLISEAFEVLKVMLNDNSIALQLGGWQLQQNPWPIYREQFDQLAQQCQDIVEWGNDLMKTQETFHKINTLILNNLQSCKTDVQDIEQLLKTTIDFFETETSVENIQQLGKISNKVQELRNIIKVPNHRDSFLTQSNQLIETLPNSLEIPIDTDRGRLMTRSIAFQKDTKTWLESEITPQLYDLWEVTEGIINGMKMVLINMRNQVAVLSAQMKENGNTPKTIVTHSLTAFKNKVKVVKERMDGINEIVKERLKEDFKIAYIYRTEQAFLPTKFQSPLNALPLNANNLPAWIKNWTTRQTANFQKQIEVLDYEKSLSPSEKIVRFIKSRTSSDPYYSDIFLTSGYVGESFWVGRTNKIKRAQALIENWQQGFRGSILLTGKRLSGKSLFGERIANLHFANQTIRLFPDTTLSINGRKIEIGYDLNKALNLIKNNSRNRKVLVWIDNLELWWDINIPLNRNVRALKKFIDNNNHQLFFMVAMSDWLKAHLTTYHNLDRIFQAEIQMDKMSLTEIEQAIDIRHGATHKELIENDLSITINQFKKAVKPVYSHANGNIGESLHLWTAAIHKINESKVYYDFKATYGLPSFLNTDMATILTSIILQKRTNEYRLRKLFGPAFSSTYIGIIKRLLGTGVLHKRLDDWIEVNEVIANPLAEMLVNKKFLKN